MDRQMERTTRIIELATELGIIRPRDVEAEGIPREYLLRLHREGTLVRIGRGLYVLPDALTSEFASLAEVARRVPKAVVCLLSALQFHTLTTQMPSKVWIAIEGTAWRPEIDNPSLQVVRFSGQAFHFGIERHEVSRVPVRVYSPAKTIADCFKYRNKIGLDVALEALRDAWQSRKTTMDELWSAAMTCRVAVVMRPYLESLT